MTTTTHSALALLGGPAVRTAPFPKHTTMIGEEEKRLVLEVLEDGELSGFSGRAGSRFLGGPRVQELEAHVREYFGTRHAISFNSATSALHGMIAAGGIGPGDEVITSAFSMAASASAVLMHNAVPVFADIDPATYCLDVKSVESRITPRTKAILTVNLYGHPSALDALSALAKARGLLLFEDNAQSAGATLNGRMTGTWGDAAALSLNYHKAIQSGEGGLVITDDDEIALRCQLIRNHGEVVVPDIGRSDMESQLGWNYRLTELAAAVAIPQLGKLETLVRVRRELAERMTGILDRFDCMTAARPAKGCTHTYYLYPIQFDAAKAGMSRATFAKAMAAEGFALNQGYVTPLYWLPMYQNRHAYPKGCPFTCGHHPGDVDYSKGLCPVIEDLHVNTLLVSDICKYPNTPEDIDGFGLAVEKVLAHRAALAAAGHA